MVVENGNIQFLSSGCHEQIRYLAAPLAPLRQETLHLQRSSYVSCRGFHQLKSVQGCDQPFPFLGVPRRIAHFQVADTRPSQVPRNGERLDYLTNPGSAESLENTGVDQISQRQA